MDSPQEQIELGEARKIFSRDEMNLAEFPLTVLSTRVNSSQKTLEFTDSVRGRNGEPIKRHWIVTGADKFGLPTASDDEVLLGLLKLSVQSGFHDRKIYFTRYELLKILRWTTEGRSYQRLQNAFDRLSGVRIKATNAFYDNESKAHSTRNFGIIDAYEINHAGETNSKPSFFLWSEVLFKSFQVGFIKKLDLDFYLSLQSAVSKRLYRFLDKHFWYKARLQINLFTLAHEKLGVSRNYRYASSLKQQLDPAIEELVKSGFLAGAKYQGRGQETEIVFVAASKTPRALATTTSSRQQTQSTTVSYAEDQVQSDLTPLQEELVRRGIRAAQAKTLLNNRSEAELLKISKIVEYYDSLLQAQSRLVSKSPVGFLYRAVENAATFSLPLKMQAQTDLQFAKPMTKPIAAKVDRSSQYLIFRQSELQRLLREIEPSMLSSMRVEVESKLVRLKGKISESGFENAIQHGVEEKILKLFAVPDFDEWQRKNRGGTGGMI